MPGSKEKGELEIVNLGGGRGLYRYGSEVQDSRGSTARVQDSSAVGGPFCWLFVEMNPKVYKLQERGGREVFPPGQASLHLTVGQAYALRDRLDLFVRVAGAE